MRAAVTIIYPNQSDVMKIRVVRVVIGMGNNFGRFDNTLSSTGRYNRRTVLNVVIAGWTFTLHTMSGR